MKFNIDRLGGAEIFLSSARIPGGEKFAFA
jgi:hypothetical protein